MAKALIEKTTIGQIARHIKEVYRPNMACIEILLDMEAINKLHLKVRHQGQGPGEGAGGKGLRVSFKTRTRGGGRTRGLHLPPNWCSSLTLWPLCPLSSLCGAGGQLQRA